FDAVTVDVPTVFKVMLKTAVPDENAALSGSLAIVSLEVIWTTSFVLIRFQLLSTAFTVTLKALPAICDDGVPVFPLAVPGADVSPGTSNCSCANGAGFTLKTLLTAFGNAPPVAVNCLLPAASMRRFV